MTAGHEVVIFKWTLVLLATAALLFSGCGSSSDTNDTDFVSLSVNGETPRKITEEEANNYFSAEPLVVASLIGGGGGSFTLGAMGVGAAEPLYEVPDHSMEIFFYTIPASGTGTFDVTDGEVGYGSPDGFFGASGDPFRFPGSAGTITFNKYGAVGKKIEGEFDLLLVNESDPGQTMTLTGGFTTTREPDNWNPDCLDPPTAGTTHFIETRPQLAGEMSDTFLAVFDTSGKFVCANRDGFESQLYYSGLAVQLSSGQQYLVRIDGQTGGGIDAPYAVQVTTSGFDPTLTGVIVLTEGESTNDDPAAPDPLSVNGGFITAVVQDPANHIPAGTNDADWYSFTAQ